MSFPWFIIIMTAALLLLLFVLVSIEVAAPLFKASRSRSISRRCLASALRSASRSLGIMASACVLRGLLRVLAPFFAKVILTSQGAAAVWLRCVRCQRSSAALVSAYRCALGDTAKTTMTTAS